MKVVAIVAASENNVIGINNDMPWRLPDDFKFFKKTTMGHPMIMGSNTWHTLEGKPLPGRAHWIISKSITTPTADFQVFSSPESALEYAKNQQQDLVFIIGGGSIYHQMLPYTDEILMTRIHTHIQNGQVFFPEIRNGGWKKITSSLHEKDDKHPYSFTFERWMRAK